MQWEKEPALGFLEESMPQLSQRPWTSPLAEVEKAAEGMLAVQSGKGEKVCAV